MAAFASLVLISLLATQVSGLSTYSDDKLRNQRKQSLVLDAAGRMQARPDEGAGEMKRMFPFYHTSDEITAEAKRLSKGCNGMLQYKNVKENGVDIDVVTVRKPTAKPANKVFLLFGEHSRELISPESGLYFIKALCSEVPVRTESMPGLLALDRAADVLEDAEFQMVLNANPRSRRKVEAGEFCLRTNPDGVDLNRNWDEHYEHEAATFGATSNPGPNPFSEPETRIFKKLVTDYAPTTFLTVHSGTRGMYMPWAYDMKHLAHYNGPSMLEVLRKLDKDHCQCPFGAAGKEVGYPCPGTCLDYAYAKLKTPFSYAFEIYTSHDEDDDLKERWQNKMQNGGAQLLENGNHLAHEHFHDLFHNHTSDFVNLRPHKFAATSKVSLAETGAATNLDSMACFGTFNPPKQDDYENTLKNWAQAYLKMSSLIAQKVRAGQVPQASADIE